MSVYILKNGRGTVVLRTGPGHILNEPFSTALSVVGKSKLAE